MLWFRKNENKKVKIDENVVRWHIQFFGKVQNVGFRFTACQIAKELDLTGWVRNEMDGSVTMEVQGPREKMDEVIRYLHQDPYIRIDDYKVRELTIIPSENKFTYEY